MAGSELPAEPEVRVAPRILHFSVQNGMPARERAAGLSARSVLRPG